MLSPVTITKKMFNARHWKWAKANVVHNTNLVSSQNNLGITLRSIFAIYI